MRLDTIKPLFESTSFSPRSFPMLSGTVTRRRERYESLLAKMSSYLEAGELLKSEFAEIKELNRFIEDAVRALINDPYLWRGAANPEKTPYEVREELDTANVAIHTIAGKLKKTKALQKKHDVEVVRVYIKFLEELLPLADIQTKLKGMIVVKKRADLSKAHAKAASEKAMLSHTDTKRVHAVLISISKQVYAELLKSNIEYITKMADRWEKQYDPADRNTTNSKFNAKDAVARKTVDRLLINKYSFKDPEQFKPDYVAEIKTIAKEQTDEVLTQFVNKNTSKLALILFKKNNLKDIKMVRSTIRYGIIEGELSLTFDDESSFYVVNKIVFGRSKHGTEFYRFPTTFHNVKMADGSKMSAPSEEKMKDVFAA